MSILEIRTLRRELYTKGTEQVAEVLGPQP